MGCNKCFILVREKISNIADPIGIVPFLSGFYLVQDNKNQLLICIHYLVFQGSLTYRNSKKLSNVVDSKVYE